VQIDILCNVALPVVIDRVTTWAALQPSPLEVMAARGGLPQSYSDMAACHPDLFPSAGAAEQAMRRAGNPLQTSICEEDHHIGVCRGFLPLHYRRKGARGPASVLLYDPAVIGDPIDWLAARLGCEVALVDSPARGRRPLLADAAGERARGAAIRLTRERDDDPETIRTIATTDDDVADQNGRKGIGSAGCGIVADCPWSEEMWFRFEERAGILEYDARYPRAEAERLAREDIAAQADGRPE
jgi:hypothetical protein